ncbi:MAG: hypothetical protein ACHQYP_10320 [Nitrospiria bacterium]
MNSSQAKTLSQIPEALKPFALVLEYSNKKNVFELVKRENGKIIPADFLNYRKVKKES